MTAEGHRPAMVDAIDIFSVVLVESHSKLNVNEDPPSARENIGPVLTIKVRDQVDMETRYYSVFLTFRAVLQRAEVELYSSEATYLVSYELRPELTEEDVQRDREWFATHNATFNAWPFYREFLYSMAMRMGHDAIVLPLLRLNTDVPSAQAEAVTE